METILIIEDEKVLAELLAFNLEKEGHRTAIALDGPSGLTSAKEILPDLILLDLMIPGLPGTEDCKQLKKHESTSGIPVIMITARGEEIDRVVGFEVGADDYVVKPFSVRELLLRVKAVLRRAKPGETGGKLIKAGGITIDTARHQVFAGGQQVLLTTTEYKLLLTLAERTGRVQGREQLLKDVWGILHAGDTRTVDTHVTRLRTKLGEAGEILKTVRGFGYKMEEQ